MALRPKCNRKRLCQPIKALYRHALHCIGRYYCCISKSLLCFLSTVVYIFSLNSHFSILAIFSVIIWNGRSNKCGIYGGLVCFQTQLSFNNEHSTIIMQVVQISSCHSVEGGVRSCCIIYSLTTDHITPIN